MADVRELIVICANKRVFIQTHNFPDPDAIASAYGLQKLLERYNIRARLFYDGSIDKVSTAKMLSLLDIDISPASDYLSELRDEDCIICVDSQKNAGNMTDFTGEEIAAIDHHPTVVPIQYRYSDIRIVGACATIITLYYIDRGLTPEPKVATALLYGLKMDTNHFTRGVTEEDLRAFSFLLPLADQRALSLLEKSQLEFADLRAYGSAIENSTIYDDFGFSRIPFSCPDAMVAILADFMLSLVEVRLAVIYCTRPDGLKFSVRTERPDVHAGELVRKALEGIGSGGGHAYMAGGFVPAKNIPLLGQYPYHAIQERFIKAVDPD